MSEASRHHFNRRSVLKTGLAVLAGGALARTAEATEPAIKNVNQASSPSTLKITDMRYAVVVKPGPSPCVLIRIDTNQGVYGLGGVRDVAGWIAGFGAGSQRAPGSLETAVHRARQRTVGLRRQHAGGVCRRRDASVLHIH